jgi:hypothetical protein
MKAKVLKIEQKKSYQGGDFYYVFLKGEDGRSFKTCLYPRFRNFTQWKPILEKWEALKYSVSELWLNNLNVKSGNLIDADSQIRMELF